MIQIRMQISFYVPVRDLPWYIYLKVELWDFWVIYIDKVFPTYCLHSMQNVCTLIYFH